MALGPKPVAMEAAESGDVLMMRTGIEGQDRHIGVFADNGNVLHIERGTGSIIERVKSQRFQWRPIQAYRLA